MLKGKKAIITGASYGLGAVCAKALEKAGASLILISRSQIKTAKPHISISCDLTKKDELRLAIEKAGDVDIVLHVLGGGLGLRDPLLSWDDLQKLFTLNVGAAAEINRLVLPGMIKRGSGNLVHVGSVASSEASASVGYNTVKAALSAYVRFLGREVAGSGIVATGILPGSHISPGNSWERLKERKPEVVEKVIEDRIPRKFLGSAEELIPIILLLCSKQASMMSGCMVPIDAGEGRAYG